MITSPEGPLHAFLSGTGRDARGRLVADILRFSNEELERHHDYIQWLFLLPDRSAAQPNAPVLSDAEIQAIRNDPGSVGTLESATRRMLDFYRDSDGWLRQWDHNHLRITRIIKSLRLLLGQEAARGFYDAILTMQRAGGSPVNAESLRFWSDAARG